MVAGLAWVGMVLTHPEYRRRGFARRLISHALEYARERGVMTLKLDATSAGRRLVLGSVTAKCETIAGFELG
jgi:GNAT superfamily N-acetyltransferase